MNKKINFNDDESLSSVIKKVSSTKKDGPSANYIQMGIVILVFLGISGLILNINLLWNYPGNYMIGICILVMIYQLIKFIIKKLKKSKNEPKFKRK